MNLTASAKHTLRRNMKLILKSITTKARKQQSQLIFEKLLETEWYRTSSRVGVYLSMTEEVQTDSIVNDLLKGGKHCFIPWYSGDTMKLVRLENADDLACLPLTKWNIRQPADEDIAGRDDALHTGLDLVLVPGLGFTKTGCRIGRGKGYYDRFLNEIKQSGKSNNVKTVGLAFREQILENIPCSEQDFTLDMVIFPD